MKQLWQPAPTRLVQPRWQALGAPAVGGVLALAMAAVLALGVAPQWQAQRQALAQQQRVDRLAAADRARTAKAVQAPTPWPAATERAARVAALIDLALAHGITLTGTEQPPRREASGPVAWQVFSTPARAPYASLRAFIADALLADPALALEALRLRRSADTPGQVDADLRWAFGQASEAPALDDGGRP